MDKLKPCIETGELDACVDETARVAKEMGIDGEELLGLSSETRQNRVFNFAYVLALAAAQGLEGTKMAEAYYYAGLAAQHLGNIEQAEEQYKKSIKAYPKNVAAHSNYAIMLQKLKRLEKAEEHYKRAMDAAPENAVVHSNYAILLKELKKPEEAKVQYKLAIEADPKNAVAHFNYAILLEELKRPEKAEKQYKLAIDANPKLAAAHINYANLLREKAMFSKAVDEIKIALQIELNDPYALKKYGDILADEYCLEGAIEKYREAIKYSDSMVRPVVAEIHNNLGWTHAQLKQYTKAENEFKKALVLDPLNVKANRNKRKLSKTDIDTDISIVQIFLGTLLLLSLIVSYIFFLNDKFSETVFTTQVTILIGLLIFTLLYPQIKTAKISPTGFEFELSNEHITQPIKRSLEFER
ncbi:MAG: tetratricopeptide repeat protein [Spirochaetes bacterium]|nr:tetratricopeptide repeat protein [Spirochaetota bacterium]